jgi:DNA invertase Pin-like site-specific DNA recombinase
MPNTSLRLAIYARVSTTDQTCENQLEELRQYAAARGWTVTREYVDTGVSGSKERRPALDELTADAQRRRFDAVLVWALDRLGRNLRHLVTLIDGWQACGIAFVSLREGLDATTPAGRLQLHILAALAEFERARIQERIRSGIARARRNGTRLGRPKKGRALAGLEDCAGLTHAAAAARLGVSVATIKRWRATGSKSSVANVWIPAETATELALEEPAHIDLFMSRE